MCESDRPTMGIYVIQKELRPIGLWFNKDIQTLFLNLKCAVIIK